MHCALAWPSWQKREKKLHNTVPDAIGSCIFACLLFLSTHVNFANNYWPCRRPHYQCNKQRRIVVIGICIKRPQLFSSKLFRTISFESKLTTFLILNNGWINWLNPLLVIESTHFKQNIIKYKKIKRNWSFVAEQDNKIRMTINFSSIAVAWAVKHHHYFIFYSSHKLWIK